MTTAFFSEGMFTGHIQNSELKKPGDFNNYDPEKFPHFHLFMCSHLAMPIETDCLEDNANIISKIPEDEIKTITFEELAKMGVIWGTGNLV